MRRSSTRSGGGAPPRPPVLALLSALFLAAAGLPAEDDLSLFTDTVEVELVNVEVAVTDAEGRPVRGLAQEDFEVYENGERVAISHFFAVEERQVVGAGDAPAVSSPGVAGPETRRLNLVVVVDNLNLRPENRNLLFKDLRQYLEDQLHPQDRVMLVTLDQAAEVALPFTADQQQLLATLERLSREVGRFVQHDAEHRQLLQRLQQASLVDQGGAGQLNSLAGGSTSDFEETVMTAERLAQEIRVVAERRYQRVRATARALGRFTESLAGLPGRKAVLYLSDGLPLRAADSLVEAWIGKYEGWMVANQQQRLLLQVTSLGSMEFDAGRDFTALVEQAAANGVVFYPITPAGRGAPSGLSAEFGGSRVTTGGGPMSAGVAQLETSSREASLLTLADGTGGLALTQTTNLGELLARLTRDFQSFYSLGYQPPAGPEEAAFRKVEVKVRGEGLTVRHLSGYRKKGVEERLEERTLAALHYGTEEDNPLGLRLDPQAAEKTGRDRYRVPVMVKIPFERLLLLPEEEHHSARVLLVVVAGDAEGRLSPLQRIELPVQIPNDRILAAVTGTMAYPMELEMRGGRQRIAVGALDRLARIEATVAVDLEVGAEAASAASK